MASFEELGVTPELVEALAAEGIEKPSDFQESAIPVLLRGNSLMAQAGPGAGTLVAYGIPLLQSVDPAANAPGALVLTPTPQVALRLAQSLSRLAQASGHKVGALGSPSALPTLASILFATPEDVVREIRRSEISADLLGVLVVDGFGVLGETGLEALDTLVEFIPKDCQKIVLGQPLPNGAEKFAKAHLHKAVHIPPKAADTDSKDATPQRGHVAYRVTGETKEAEILQVVSGALDDGCLLYTSDAADECPAV